MNIGEAARRSGLSTKTIRYYEQISLIDCPQRSANGYRDFSRQDLAELRFIHRARQVGFSVEECRQLLEIYRDPGRQASHVKQRVLDKCDQLQARIDSLEEMLAMLQGLASRCSGHEGPECAILDELVKHE